MHIIGIDSKILIFFPSVNQPANNNQLNSQVVMIYHRIDFNLTLDLYSNENKLIKMEKQKLTKKYLNEVTCNTFNLKVPIVSTGFWIQ